MWKQKLYLLGIGISLLLSGIFCSNLPANPGSNPIDDLCKGENAEVAGALNLIWTHTLDGGVGSLPAVSGDVVVVVDRWAKLDPHELRTFVLGIQPETGDMIWQYPNEEAGNWFKHISASGGNISITQMDEDHTEKTVVISTASGEIISEPSFGEIIPGFPNFVLDMLVTPNHLFLRTSDRSTTVFDIAPIQEIDHFPADEIISAFKQFEYMDGLVYSLYGNRLDVIQDTPYQRLYRAMLTRWGQPTRSYSLDFDVHDRQLLVIFPEGLTLYSLENQLIEIWSNNTDQYADNENLWPPAFVDNQAYLFNKNGILTTIELEQGTISSQPPPINSVKPISTPVFYKGKLYAVYSDGTLLSFSLPDFKEQIEIQSTVVRHNDNEGGEFHSPGVVVANDKLLVSFGCKNLYAVQIP